MSTERSATNLHHTLSLRLRDCHGGGEQEDSDSERSERTSVKQCLSDGTGQPHSGPHRSWGCLPEIKSFNILAWGGKGILSPNS